MPAMTEQEKKVIEIEPTNRGDLQLEQRGLAGVRVHGVDSARCLQRVVQRVAAGAGDYEDGVVRRKLKGLPVHCRIFPASVVDERPGIDRVEHFLVEVIDEACNA
jgi:hypothetical protein